jgi:hypothetical protein
MKQSNFHKFCQNHWTLLWGYFQTNIDGHVCWISNRGLPFIVCRPMKTNFCIPVPFSGNKQKFWCFRFSFATNKRKLPFSVHSVALGCHKSGFLEFRTSFNFSELVFTSTEFHGILSAKLSRNTAEFRQKNDTEFWMYRNFCTWRHGDMETWRHGHGDIVTRTRRHGDMGTWRNEDIEIWTPGHMETWTHRGMDTWRHGPMETRTHRDTDT